MIKFFPAIDILDGKAVRLAKGSYEDVTSYNDDPVEQAAIFADAGAQWIHIVDLDGAKKGESSNHLLIEKILSKVDVNIEVGGGIRTLETIDNYARAGAKRIVLGTKLATDPDFVAEAVKGYGELLVAGVDALDGQIKISGWIDCGQVSATTLIGQLQDMGIKHLVYTDISKDGMQSGVDVDHYVEIAKIAGFKVVASGGVASIKDIQALAAQSHYIEGVIAGRAIYEGSLDIKQAIEACK